ncbi:MAG: hypothetical protein K0R62_6968 [Nonomuraea muscovyensis]|jgi:DNA-binding response OmpR family regulator|nr:hypothetical protein [Nonomuraea muscovyensis]
MRVLVVEDEEEPADAVTRGLRPHAIENVSGRGYRL